MIDLGHIDPGNSGGSVRIPQLSPPDLRPVTYACDQCDKTFKTRHERYQHILDIHPYHRPALLLHGRDAGIERIKVTRASQPEDWHVLHAEQLYLDGRPVTETQLSQTLAKTRQGIHRVQMISHSTQVHIDFDFAIPEESDQQGVERTFEMVVAGHFSDINRVTHFIDRCGDYSSAAAYVEGISQYLYGILAKDQRGDTKLKYTDHKQCFNRALDALKENDRPLAALIRAVVSFCFNDFASAVKLSPSPELTSAACRLASWAGDARTPPDDSPASTEVDFPLDEATALLVGWLVMPERALNQQLDQVRAAANNSRWTAEDRAKASAILLTLLQDGPPTPELRRVAISLQHHSLFFPLAERVLESTHGK